MIDRRLTTLVVVLMLLLEAAHAAQADSKGSAVLKGIDDGLTRAKDMTYDMAMMIQNPGGEPRQITMKVHVRGNKRHTEFLSPGDVKGMKMLAVGGEQLWVYLPAYSKIRRIASHARAQTLFGADYTYDDMAMVTYSDVYSGKLKGETKASWIVEASARPGKEVSYPKVVFEVSKKHGLPTKLSFFNKQGTHLRTETRGNFACQGNVCTAKLMKMVDHTRNDHWTTIKTSTWLVNTSFSDRVFSRASLRRQ
jgi:outer membrane lipoprotein-sorting protein